MCDVELTRDAAGTGVPGLPLGRCRGMTNQQSLSAGDQHVGDERDPLPAFMRFVFVLPFAVMLGFIGLIALSWTGWGTETAPMDQLRRDAPEVVVAAVAGASAGALLAWGIAGKRWFWMHIAAAVGLLPATVMVTAYFTDTY